MEASSSRVRSGSGGRSAGVKRRRGNGGGGSGSGSTAQALNDDTLRSVFSRLDDHFDLARCSAVCTTCSSNEGSILQEESASEKFRSYFKELALDEHASSFSRGPAEVYQWIGHPNRATICRMKSGSILTGVGDKILRLWSAESCKFMNEYIVPNTKMLVDFDFDENKSHGASFNHGLCMSYADPEVVIGCEDGRAFVYDMYSRSCSSIYRLHSSPLTCLTITDDQLIAAGSTFGNVAIADQHSGQKLGVLKSAFAPTAIRCLSFSTSGQLIFAGSSAGYAHCWDLRTLRPLWENRVSPNVIYSTHHLPGDTVTLAVGGIDGVLRLICQRTGEIIRSFIVDAGRPAASASSSRQQIEKKSVRQVAPDARLDNIPTRLRPQITCLSVGMKKIVTTHGENYIRVWKFRPKSS
uniref:Uncharacterized protein n=1 Tax=Leersia perrieri TaxID=77586 RepID=A0A0D9XPQ8_9ORYZ